MHIYTHMYVYIYIYSIREVLYEERPVKKTNGATRGSCGVERFALSDVRCVCDDLLKCVGFGGLGFHSCA